LMQLDRTERCKPPPSDCRQDCKACFVLVRMGGVGTAHPPPGYPYQATPFDTWFTRLCFHVKMLTIIRSSLGLQESVSLSPIFCVVVVVRGEHHAGVLIEWEIR
jgi:hypothetical protein